MGIISCVPENNKKMPNTTIRKEIMLGQILQKCNFTRLTTKF